MAALAAGGRLRVIAGLTSDAEVDRETRAWLTALGVEFAPAEARSPGPASKFDILSVADPEEETREVARMVGAIAEATRPLARIGVLFRHREPYALLVHERLKAAGIAHTAVAATSLRHTAAGRNLVKMLAIGCADAKK